MDLELSSVGEPARARVVRSPFETHAPIRREVSTDGWLAAGHAGQATAELVPEEMEHRLEQQRRELTGYCYRMLGSA
jgi:hypothetical protein